MLDRRDAVALSGTFSAMDGAEELHGCTCRVSRKALRHRAHRWTSTFILSGVL